MLENGAKCTADAEEVVLGSFEIQNEVEAETATKSGVGRNQGQGR